MGPPETITRPRFTDRAGAVAMPVITIAKLVERCELHPRGAPQGAVDAVEDRHTPADVDATPASPFPGAVSLTRRGTAASPRPGSDRAQPVHDLVGQVAGGSPDAEKRRRSRAGPVAVPDQVD